MEITNEQRDQAYETATEGQRHLYASPAGGKKMRSIADKYNITTKEQYKNYALMVGDVILNLRNRSELPALLVQTLGINNEQALMITGELIDFLDQTPSAAPAPIPQTPNEPTYSSTQEALLSEGKPNPIPAPPNPIPAPPSPTPLS